MYVERYGARRARKLYFGLHGWSGDHETFAPLAAHLPHDAALYSADLPGCGRSPAPARLTLEAVTSEIVETLEGILDRAAATPRASVTLIGNCSGAILGLLVAERIKPRIDRLVLVDPFAYWPWYFRVFVSPTIGRYAYRSTFANPVGRWLTNQSLRKRRTAETDLTGSFGRIDHDVAQGYLALLAQAGGAERFASLADVPVEIVYGERTFAAVKKSVPLWRSVLPRARAHLLAGAGHLPILEATAELARIVFQAADNDGDVPEKAEETTKADSENTMTTATGNTRAATEKQTRVVENATTIVENVRAAEEMPEATTEEAREREARESEARV
ncbi:MAG TPA: alpha/beta fold hydrolase [Pyrinomonadaceae bacterium]|jgi:pimeloyl-ACP methyl ester carboxylesterase